MHLKSAVLRAFSRDLHPNTMLPCGRYTKPGTSSAPSSRRPSRGGHRSFRGADSRPSSSCRPRATSSSSPGHVAPSLTISLLFLGRVLGRWISGPRGRQPATSASEAEPRHQCHLGTAPAVAPTVSSWLRLRRACSRRGPECRERYKVGIVPGPCGLFSS